jgi:LysM repeat protein
MKRIITLILLALLLGVLTSCATVPTKPYEYPSGTVPPHSAVPAVRHDIVHIVAPGETLWRLGKMYDVPIKDIMSANNLKERENLEKGQRLLVPHAAPIVPVISLYPSRKWKYIIIHHSATGEGSSLSFDSYHLQKGWEGVGYHFIINNGSNDKKDGQIEVSPRWLKQKNGAHCSANNMNNRAIGICLVGNFNKENISESQLNSLVYLVDRLRKYYKIPSSRIIGHGQVRGASTDCPGKKFPWEEFKKRLNTYTDE